MDTTYDLTPLQQSMFASAAFTDRPWQYVEQIVIHLPFDTLDVTAMAQAWSDLTHAHPALRQVIFSEQSGIARQRVHPTAPIKPTLYDWRDLDQAQSDEQLHQFLDADRLAGVDATSFPSFRVNIFHTSGKGSKLVWTFPHTLLDGRAFAPLLDDVFQRYTKIITEIETPDDPTENQNVFETHCRRLCDMSHDAGEEHFAKMLAGWEGSDGLVDPNAEPGRKTETSSYLTKEQSTALVQLADQAGVSLSSVILAAWGVVLARCSGQGDVVFGNTRNGRHLMDGASDAAGCFITTVPVRLQLNPSLSIGDVLNQIRAEQIAVRPFEQTPLTSVRKRLDIPPGRQLFDSVLMFDFGTLDDQLKALGGDWENRTVDLLEEGDTPVSVAAYMGEQLKVVVEYDPAQVPNGPRLCGYLTEFLGNLTTVTAKTPLGAISILDATEIPTIQTLAGPKDTHVGNISTCIDQFQEMAAQHPDHTALEQPGFAPMTYGELNTAAQTMAKQLRGVGVGPGDIVGICMTRGMPFVTAMFAIWKAGAAFVPMDPGYPVETLNIIAQDSEAALVLTDAAAPKLDAKTRLATDLLEGETDPFELDSQQLDPDSLAYVIFTSGSTGRPKGVMVTHASLAAHASAIIPHFGLTPKDRVLQFAALSFDVALEEIVPTLLCGATLVLRTDEMAQSVPEFLTQCAALEVTVTNLPTGFWVALTDVLDHHSDIFPPLVRLVIVGGERVPFSALKRWRATLPDLRWLNGYGPTETTITCTTHEATAHDLEGKSIPIGRALSHANAWVLTKDGALAPTGTEGELFISGPAVAKGYINDPKRTAQSFTQATFDPSIGRIYATGDRVIWRNEVLHYLGRMDRQIKLRGFRIEPGQIEAALEMHEAVERVHAGLYTPKSGQSQLIAWYSAPADMTLPAPEIIKEWATQTLPPQMRPTPVPVTEWPQTPGGKIDVVRLPMPARTETAQTDDMTQDSPLTREVAELFSTILQHDDIGPTTSFFDAGGDSLSLLRLMPELERAFDVKLKPTALYSDPTPQGVVRALQAEDPDPLVVIPIQPKGDLPPLYGVHVLGDNGSFFRPLAAVLGDEQPVFGLTVGLLSDSTPTTVPDIANFYLRQIERHHPEGPLSLIAVSAGSYVTLELAQQLHDAGRDVSALILLDAEGPDGRQRIGRAARFGVHLRQILRHGWPYIAKQLATRREARAQGAAQEKLQAGTVVHDHVTADEITDVTDFVAANMLAIEAYTPQPYPKRLTIYRAGDDQFDSKEAIENGLGWASIAMADFDITDVPGDHLGILEPPNVDTLGRHIATLLQSARQDHRA
ncbi:MAG: amino acid adenylation domain-containing protein [Sulfitobacter sp.]